MAVAGGPDSIEDGLIFHVDIPRSWDGSNIENLASRFNPSLNKYGTTITASIDTTDKFGVFTYNGSTNYWQYPVGSYVPNIGGTYGGNEFTMEGWWAPTNNNRGMTPSSNGIDNWIGTSGERLYVFVCERADVNNASVTSDAPILYNGTWTHWTVSIYDDTVTIHINGKFDKIWTRPYRIARWSGQWRFGQRGNNTNWYAGKMGAMRVWNRILTSEEIYQSYNALKPRYQ